MAKGKIISGGPGGSYSVAVQYDVAAINARLLALQQRASQAQIDLSEAQNTLADIESERDALVAEQNLLIDALQDDPTTDELKALNEKSAELIAKSAQIGKQSVIVKSLTLEILSNQKEQARLSAAPESVPVDAWCADYSLGLAGDVALVEIPGGDRKTHIQIRPGYVDNAAYAQMRDGMLRRPYADIAAATTYNLAMFPGWQRWMPRYRRGTITAVDTNADTCDVSIDDEWSDHQGLSLSYTGAYADVPIVYMDCHSAVFEVGDRVLVEFGNQDKETPEANWDHGNVAVIGFLENPKPCGIDGAYLYYPLSDDAPYSWGDPYEDPPQGPINPPLGTALMGASCGVNYRVDETKHPYRIFDPNDAQRVTHGTDEVFGKYWWQHGGYHISWTPPVGIETAADTIPIGEDHAVYKDGYVLAWAPHGYSILAACVRVESGFTNLLLYVDAPGVTLFHARIDPAGTGQNPAWTSSTAASADLAALTPVWEGSNPITRAAFNKSGTRMLINQVGRVVEIDVSTWGAESLLNHTLYWDSVVDGYAVMPIQSGYAPDSDTRRDLTVEITAQFWGNIHAFYEDGEVRASLQIDGVELRNYLLYSRPIGIDWPWREEAWITVNPFFQDVQSEIFIVDHHRAHRIDDQSYTGDPLNSGDPNHHYFKRYHINEVLRGGNVVAVRNITEHHPNPRSPSADHEVFTEFTGAPAHQYRDQSETTVFYYPNSRWLWSSDPFYMEAYCSEVAGFLVSKEYQGVHVVADYRACADWVASYLIDPPYNYVGFDTLHLTAVAGTKLRAFVLSRRLFNDWDGVLTPKFEWWNLGTVDLVTETQMTGDNPRFVIRPCRVNPDRVESRIAHIGVVELSTENPFPVEPPDSSVNVYIPVLEDF